MQCIDEKVEPEKKNDAKMRDESYVSLIGAFPTRRVRASAIDQAHAAHTLPPPFAWSDTWEYRLGTSLPETTLFAFRRLFWIDTVSRLDTPAQRKEWLDMLSNPAFTAHTVGIVPEKALARPGGLSPGEYDVIEQVVTMSSLIRRMRRGSMEPTEEDRRWQRLALICRQAQGPWALDFLSNRSTTL